MRVVIDTNVAISGLLWSGPPNQILKWARNGLLRIISCEKTTAELNKVPHYSKFTKRLEALNVTPAEAIAYFMNLVLHVPTPDSIPEIITEDPFNHTFLSLASENSAHLIVSGDKHLLALKEYEGIQIVAPNVACSVIDTIIDRE